MATTSFTMRATLEGTQIARAQKRRQPSKSTYVPVIKCQKEAAAKSVNLINTGRRSMLMAGGALAAFGACPCLTCGGAAKASEWSYGDLAGPPEWTGVCKTGTIQSPIDIQPRAASLKAATEANDFSFKYAKTCKNIVNSGHGVQVNFEPGSMATLGDRTLELLQFHFHTPSEHTYKGKHTSMEVHLVHRDITGGRDNGLAVLGALMLAKPGSAPNPVLASTLANAPDVPGDANVRSQLRIDPTDLLPTRQNLGYWNYSGSLTTPPCSEAVNWFVFGDPVEISSEQVVKFQELLGNGKTLSLNNRPVQPSVDRALTGYLYI